MTDEQFNQQLQLNIESGYKELCGIVDKIDAAKKELANLENSIKQKIEVVNSLNNIGMLKLCPYAFLREQDIVDKSRELVPLVGVYFLIQDKEVVYIGQAIDIYRRIGQHQYDKNKQFNRYAFILCDKSELDIIETLYIHHFSPKYNSQSKVEPHSFGRGSGNVYKRGTPLTLGDIIAHCRKEEEV